MDVYYNELLKKKIFRSLLNYEPYPNDQPQVFESDPVTPITYRFV